jgi:hypothetical protein
MFSCSPTGASHFHRFHPRPWFWPPAMWLDFPTSPKLSSSNDEGSSRMSDEDCPNESPSVVDATGYSKEQEEANSISCEEVWARGAFKESHDAPKFKAKLS